MNTLKFVTTTVVLMFSVALYACNTTTKDTLTTKLKNAPILTPEQDALFEQGRLGEIIKVEPATSVDDMINTALAESMKRNLLSK